VAADGLHVPRLFHEPPPAPLAAVICPGGSGVIPQSDSPGISVRRGRGRNIPGSTPHSAAFRRALAPRRCLPRDSRPLARSGDPAPLPGVPRRSPASGAGRGSFLRAGRPPVPGRDLGAEPAGAGCGPLACSGRWGGRGTGLRCALRPRKIVSPIFRLPLLRVVPAEDEPRHAGRSSKSLRSLSSGYSSHGRHDPEWRDRSGYEGNPSNRRVGVPAVGHRAAELQPPANASKGSFGPRTIRLSPRGRQYVARGPDAYRVEDGDTD
jgi:hypothetical protein